MAVLSTSGGGQLLRTESADVKSVNCSDPCGDGVRLAITASLLKLFAQLMSGLKICVLALAARFPLYFASQVTLQGAPSQNEYQDTYMGLDFCTEKIWMTLKVAEGKVEYMQRMLKEARTYLGLGNEGTMRM